MACAGESYELRGMNGARAIRWRATLSQTEIIEMRSVFRFPMHAIQHHEDRAQHLPQRPAGDFYIAGGKVVVRISESRRDCPAAGAIIFNVLGGAEFSLMIKSHSGARATRSAAAAAEFDYATE